MEERLPFPGRNVVIRTPSARTLAAHGGHGGDTSAPAASGAMLELVVDDFATTIHRLSTGLWHTHALPYVVFKSPEDAARGVVNLVALDDGRRDPSTAQTPARATRQVAYAMSGVFYEFCDCYTVCPCWVDGAPDDGACAGVFAWAIERGVIDDVDVAGLRVVSISTHVGHRDGAQQQVVLFIDDAASERQVDLLRGAFSGEFGGPLEELWSLLGTLLGVERARIEIEGGDCGVRLVVGSKLDAEGVTSVGANGRETELVNGRLATVLGPRAAVGVARRLRIALADRGIDIDVVGRSAMRGGFDYHNRS